MTTTTLLGRNLKAARGHFRRTDSPRHGISQVELAKRSGVPKDTISVIERGMMLVPFAGTLESLAAVLGTTAKALEGDGGEP